MPLYLCFSAGPQAIGWIPENWDREMPRRWVDTYRINGNLALDSETLVLTQKEKPAAFRSACARGDIGLFFG
jgi:hypothetical protein